MKTKQFFFVALAIAMLATSCKDNSSSPQAKVPDPEGTITVKVRNANNGKTYVEGWFYITESNNFGGLADLYVDCQFVDYGAVRGLGNVVSIPKSGWAYQVAVIPGHGYVMRLKDRSDHVYVVGEEYVRLYVVEELVGANTNGGIIGAVVKYQYPFEPTE